MKHILFIFLLLVGFITITTSCSYTSEDGQELYPDPKLDPDPDEDLLPEVYQKALLLPNSYMIEPNGSVIIPVTKAYAVWSNYKNLLQSEISRKGNLEVSLLWQDKPGLITSVEISEKASEKSVIKVVASEKSGNAVIVFKVDNIVRWSWHIWVTNYVPETQKAGRIYEWDNNNDGIVDYVWMDRNLGAISSGIELSYADSLAACGLLYQWGRKDPYVGDSQLLGTWDSNTLAPRLASQPIYDFEGNILQESSSIHGSGIYTISISIDKKTHNLKKSITAPLGILIPNHRDHFPYEEWYIMDNSKFAVTDNMLWGNNTIKGVFDPCPQGWRVPPYKNDLSPWNGLTNATTSHSSLGVFPLSGIRENKWLNSPIGSLARAGLETSIWSATTPFFGNIETSYESTAACNVFGLTISQTENQAESILVKSIGASVRCVKEH